jgi:hypothetical protein
MLFFALEKFGVLLLKTLFLHCLENILLKKTLELASYKNITEALYQEHLDWTGCRQWAVGPKI